jgi:futalosine hydrolase
MRILVVAATPAEVAPLSAAAGIDSTSSERPRSGRVSGRDVDLLVTGVGMVATAYWCARGLSRAPYDLALNLGLCGTFDPAIPVGRVVHVVSDRLSELGAEDGDAFLPLHALGLFDPDEPPFAGGAIVNHAPPVNAALARLTPARGVTVNTVHGCETSIADVVRRVAPQVESMEGAAFMYACALSGVPYAQVRAVSNVVERRDRASWQIGPAVIALGVSALEILESA